MDDKEALDKISQEWLAKQQFNQHCFDMANKWIEFANDVVKAWEDYRQREEIK